MLRRLFALLMLVAVGGAGSYGAWRWSRVEPPMQKATRLIALRNVFGAQVVLRGVIKADPRNAEAHLLLARTQFATADWLSAEKEVKTLRALGYDRMVVGPMLVRSYIKQGRYQDILADIPPIASKPEEQYLNLALRSAGFLGLNDLAQAQALVDAARRLAPDEYQVHLQQASVALAKKDVLVGIREVDLAIAQRPTSTEGYVTKSQLLVMQLDMAGAVLQLDMAVDLTPMAPDLRMQRAGLELTLGMDKQAQEDVDAVFSLTSANATALFYNAVLMLRARQYADANVEFDKLGVQTDLFPKAYFHKAEIALALGNTQSALESLDRFLKLVPGDVEGIRMAAQLEMRSARPERALALLSPVTRPGSRDAPSIDLQGRAYFMLGRMPEAIDSFRRAAVLAPENKEFSSHLAAAQTQFGVAPVPADDAVTPLQ